MKKEKKMQTKTAGRNEQADRETSFASSTDDSGVDSTPDDKMDELDTLLKEVISPIVETKYQEILQENEGFRNGTEALNKIKTVSSVVSQLPNSEDIKETIDNAHECLLKAEDFDSSQKTVMEKIESQTTVLSDKIQGCQKTVTNKIESQTTDISDKIQGCQKTVTNKIESQTTDISKEIQDCQKAVLDEIDKKVDALLKEKIDGLVEKLRINGEAAQKDFETMKVFLWGLVAVAGCGLICNLVLLFLYLR